MVITDVTLKNFRCFKNSTFSFDKKIVVIEGNNGSGKTSLLEALYYACYLRSFRTRLNRELINFNQDNFFLQVDYLQNGDVNNQIQVGCSDKEGKLVKFNQKQVSSFKDIISSYQIIGATEDDLQLVGGAPEVRRSFLNQSLFLDDPFVGNHNFLSVLKVYKQTLAQRNSFLARIVHSNLNGNLRKELQTWTKQLWEQSIILQKRRVEFLKDLEREVNKLLEQYFSDLEPIKIKLEYLPRNLNLTEDFKVFWDKYEKNILEKELKWVRTMFGMHLDDFSITFKKKRARTFASRGQQKLIVFLLKVVQMKMLQKHGGAACLLLDDFLTDFDSIRLSSSLSLLKDLKCQIFLTCPLSSFIISKVSNIVDFQILEL